MQLVFDRVIAITTRIEAKKRAEQKPNRRLVRNNQDVFARMLAHQFEEHRQSACCHGQAAFATVRRKCIWVPFPLGGFFRKFLLYFAPRHLLSATVRNFPKPVARLHLQLVRCRKNLSSLSRAAKRGCVNRDNFLVTQTFRQATCLFATFIGKSHIGRARKSILGAQNGDAMSHHENTRCCRFHTIRHDVNLAKRHSRCVRQI